MLWVLKIRVSKILYLLGDPLRKFIGRGQLYIAIVTMRCPTGYRKRDETTSSRDSKVAVKKSVLSNQ